MSEEVTLVGIEPKVNVDFNLTKDDLVDIKISEIEQTGLAAISAFEKEQDALNSERRDLDAQLKKFVTDFIEKNTKTFGDDLKVSLEKLYKVKRTIHHEIESIHNRVKISVHFRVNQTTADSENEERDYNSESITFRGHVALPPEHKEFQDKIDALNTKINEVAIKITRERKELATLPMKARLMKSNLTRAAMLASEQGKNLLASLGTVPRLSGG